MKRRILSSVFSLFILCSMILGMPTNSNAEEMNGRDVVIDGSLLTNDDSSTGTSYSPAFRGKHLMDGESGISKVGSGRIYVYGQTTADHVVDFVAVLMDVERLDESDGKWGHVAAYTEDARDKYYIIVDDTIMVDRGYYYRVHCEHFAGNDDEEMYDSAFSLTNGIWIP